MESVTEQQVQGVLAMLSAVLAPDNQVRKQQESLLLALRKDHPNEFVVTLLKIMFQSQEESLKVLSAILLRQIFSSLHPSLQTWTLLTPETQSLVTSSLLSLLEKETSWVMAKRLGETISELAVLLLAGDSPSGWPGLLTFLVNSFNGSPKQAAASMHIMGGLCTFFHQELLQQQDALAKVCISGLESSELTLKVSTIEFLTNFLGILEKSEMKAFLDVLPSYLRAVVSIIGQSEKDGEEALKNLRDLAETEEFYFKGRLNLSWELVEYVCGLSNDNLGIKNLALDFIVSLAGKLDDEFKKNVPLCEALCAQIFKVMVSIEQDVESSWATPPDGFEDNEDETIEIDYAKLGRKQISRLVEGLGDDFILPTVLANIHSALTVQSEDWRIRYAALMAISELGQFIEETNKIAELVPILVTHAASAHPKIRYAALHCIGQLSEDYEEKFTEAHHSTLIPILLSGLADPISRVRAESANSLSLFSENCGSTVAISFLPSVMPSLVSCLSSGGCSLVLENVLDCLTSISEVSKESFGSYYTQLMPYFLNLINSSTSEAHKKLRGKAIEAMSTICTCVGQQVFSQHCEQIVSVLQHIQNTQLTDNDSLRAYVLSAWQRLAASLGASFAQYVGGILPGLLQAITSEVSVSISSKPEEVLDLAAMMNESSNKVSITTADLEEKDVALQALLTIIDVLKGGYAPFVEKTAEIVLPLIGYTANPGIREVSATILSSLVVSVKDAGLNAVHFARQFLGSLWTTTLNELDRDGQTAKLESIKTIIDTVHEPFMSPEEVNQSGENLIKILENSLAHRKRMEEAKALGEDSESEDELITEINKKEEDTLHTAISEVLGALFKTHKEHSLTIVNFLYSNVLSKFLTPSSSAEDHKFAIFVIDDVIEFLGEAMAGDKWNALAEALFVYSTDQDDAVRQAAVYGVGVLATHTSVEKFNPWASKVLQILDQSMHIPVQKSKKSHAHARDNAISSLGKVIKYQSSNLDLSVVIPAFVGVLPLRHDKVEARMMHDLLADLSLSHSSLVFGGNYERLSQVVNVFSNVLETKLCDAGTVPKIKQIIVSLQGANVPGLNEVIAGLTDLQKTKLNNVLSA
jgi:hypothetical protein